MRCACLLLAYLTLAPSAWGQAQIRGHVFDEAGSLLTSNWQVELKLAVKGGKPRRQSTALDPETGGFLFENLPLGRAEVWASSADGRETARRNLFLMRGQDRYAALVTPDPGPERTLHLQLRPPWMTNELPIPSDLRLVDTDGVILRPFKGPSRRSHVSFRGLERRAYELRIGNKRFAPRRVGHLWPGNTHVLQLSGSADEELLIEGKRGRPARRAEVQGLRIQGTTMGRIPLHPKGTPAHRGLRVDGLLPSTNMLLVRPEGSKLNAIVKLDGIQPDTLNQIRVPWPKTTPKRTGRLHCEDGFSWGKIKIRLLNTNRIERFAAGSGAGAGAGAGKPPKNQIPAELDVRTDEAGLFPLRPLRPGLWNLGIRLGPMSRLDIICKIDLGDSSELSVHCPDSATLHGRLISKRGPLAPTYRIQLEPKGGVEWPNYLVHKATVLVRPDEDGRFTIPHLPRVRIHANVTLPADKGKGTRINLPKVPVYLTQPQRRSPEYVFDLDAR